VQSEQLLQLHTPPPSTLYAFTLPLKIIKIPATTKAKAKKFFASVFKF